MIIPRVDRRGGETMYIQGGSSCFSQYDRGKLGKHKAMTFRPHGFSVGLDKNETLQAYNKRNDE